MSTQVQIRKGNTIQTAAFTGAIAEITVDTDKKTLVVHDGVTVGGIPLARESALSANQVFSQAAFNAANSAATLSAATDLTQNNSITAAFLAANSADTLSAATDLTQNNNIAGAFTQANTAVNNALSASNYANGAFVSSNTIQTYVTSANANISLLFSYVNSANANITAAFAVANQSLLIDTTQNNSITAAFTQANTGVNNALSASNYANAAFLVANSSLLIDVTQNNSIAAAFTRANNSISANAGGTITGDLVVTGNLTINGQTTYSNTVQLLVGDNLITLNAELPTSVTPIENAGIEINRGNTFANSSLLWIEASGKWQANSGSSTGAYFLANEAVVTAAFLAANSAATLSAATDATQNTNITNAQNTGDAAFLAANSAATLSAATDATQNNSITAAFLAANSSATLSAATDETQNNSIAAAFTQANSVYLPSVTRLDVTHSGSSAYLLDQYTGNNPELYIRAGETLAFSLNVTGHPFLIRVSNGGPNYNTGLTHVTTTGTVTTGSSAEGQVAGTLYWKVPAELAGNTYVYQCSIHSGMVGNIVIERPNHDFTNITVAAGTYGNATHYGVESVAANGRVTSVSTFPVVDSSAIAFSIALG